MIKLIKSIVLVETFFIIFRLASGLKVAIIMDYILK